MELDLGRTPHNHNRFGLFRSRRFLPIFLATFLGAFNDNMLRSGLVVLIAYSASRGLLLPARPEILVTVCSALLIMPLMLFSPIAGALADKFEKSRLVRYTKIAEVGIMACVCYGFATENIILLMCMLFVSGTHTAFYSPIKFSILPDHLNTKELLAANGFMAGGSYLAILFGLITGGFLVEMPYNVIGVAAMTISVAGLVASYYILPSQISNPGTEIIFNLLRGLRDIIGYAYEVRIVFLSILALSWFLLVGSVFMAQFANYAQAVMRANNEVYILFLTVFSIGIAIGSLLCDVLLKGEITLRLMPFSALGVSLFTYLMVLATPVPTHEGLIGAFAFLALGQHWPVLASMLMVAVCGGVYIVPLYATLQAHTPSLTRSRIMAASNLSDALFMTFAALVSAFLLSLQFSIVDLFVIVATLNLLVCWYGRKISP